MFRAVLDQVLNDYCSRSKEKDDVEARREAHEWLDMGNEDFLEICEMAFVPPEFVFKARDYLMRYLHDRQ